MPYFILGLAVLIGLYFLFRGLRGTNVRNLQRNLAIVVGIVAAVVIIFFAVTGRMGPFGWAVMLLPLLLRWRALTQAMRNMRGPTPGKNSDIETPYLRMTLEHDSGVLRGTVLQGQLLHTLAGALAASRTTNRLCQDGEIEIALRTGTSLANSWSKN